MVKVDEQDNSLPRHSKVRQQLRLVNWIDVLDGLQFDDDSILNKEVQSISDIK